MSIRKAARFLKLKQLSEYFNFNSSIKLNGKKYIIPVIKNTGLLNLSLKEDWFFELLKLLKLPKDSSFIDVGVNVGQTLLTFRSCYNNPYWGFEPNPNCVFYLNTLVKKNSFSDTYVIPVGLSLDNEVAKFYTKNDVDSAGTIVKELRPDYYEEKAVNYVPLFSFDKLNLPEIGTISLIKIDVEGAELEVISGFVETLKRQRPAIICEILDCHSEKSVTSMQVRAQKLVALIQDLGYNIYRIIHEADKITFEKTNEVKLKLWTVESWNLNDYLFVSKEKEQPQNIKF